MPDTKKPPPAPGAARTPSDPARSGSFVQRTLGKSVQALDATAVRLRRLQLPTEQREKTQPAPGAEAAASEALPSGRVAHDARGNAVWKWAAEASAAALESTSRLLKKLEVPELKVDDKPRGLSLEEDRPGGGYDPYNRGKSGRR